MYALLIVSLFSIVSAGYDDNFARTKMLSMSGAAYADPTGCVKNALSKGQVTK